MIETHPREAGRLQGAVAQDSNGRYDDPDRPPRAGRGHRHRRCHDARPACPNRSRRAAAFWRASRWSSPASSLLSRALHATACRSLLKRDGDRCADGEIIAEVRGPRPHAARTRARRAEFPAAPERRGDTGAPLCRRRGGHGLPGARYAQDHARPARVWRRRPPRPAASPTTAWASTTPS